MHSETITPSASMTTDELLDLVRELNARPEIDGILVQLPLPGHIDSQRDSSGCGAGERRRRIPSLQCGIALDGAARAQAVHASRGNPDTQAIRDSDCGPERSGGGAQRHRRQADGDAPAAGERYGHGLPFAHARSAGVMPDGGYSGRSHRPRRYDDGRLHQAGRGGYRRGDEQGRVESGGRTHLRPSAAGRFRPPAAACWWETCIPGDMARVASAYTPVPGGVGPLTIAMLMQNTIESAERRTGIC